MDLGLSWLSPNIYDAKKVHALHHLQNVMNLQKTEYSGTIINQNNETESLTFLNGVKNCKFLSGNRKGHSPLFSPIFYSIEERQTLCFIVLVDNGSRILGPLKIQKILKMMECLNFLGIVDVGRKPDQS